jgi:hypothetical protein
MGARFKRLQGLPVGGDKLKRPDVGGFDAKPSDKHILRGQFRLFPEAFDRLSSGSPNAAESENLQRYKAQARWISPIQKSNG